MIPPQVTVIPQFILIKELDWVDTYQGLIVPQAFTAFGVFLLRQFFLTIPYELEDAARIDGASRFGCFWRIILPLSGPALATLAVFAFLPLEQPAVATHSLELRRDHSLSSSAEELSGPVRDRVEPAMAAAAIATIPTVIVYLFRPALVPGE